MPAWMTNNRLYDLAQQGRRLTPWWGVFVLGSAMLLVSSLAGLPVQLIQAASSGFSESGMASQPSWLAGLLMGLMLAASFGVLILFVWLWARLYEKRPFATLGFERRNALWQYGRGLLIGVLTFGGAVGLMALFGYVAPEAGDPARMGLAALGGILLIFLPGWLIQGAAEEVLTRGWMLPVLGARYRPWVGLLLSSLFFMGMHGLNPNVSLLALVNLALYGLFAALYALREESLWGICAFHSVWNWAQGNLFGLAVSGQETGVGTLLDLMEAGPDLFTGGAFGPEGGLAVTLMLVLGSVLMLVWPPPVEPCKALRRRFLSLTLLQDRQKGKGFFMQIEILHRPSYSLGVVKLAPNEQIRAEAGAMVSMSSGITLETRAEGGLLKSLGRALLGGESFFQNVFKAPPQGGEITLAPDLPGDVFVLKLNNRRLLVQAGSYMASETGIEINAKVSLKALTAMEGFSILEIFGSGQLLLSSYGAIHEKVLQAGESYVVDSTHLVAFDADMPVAPSPVGSLKSTLFSGEGAVVQLSGPGQVLLQTRSPRAFLDWLIPQLPRNRD